MTNQTQTLRETIWLHIKSHPGIDIHGIETYLNNSNSSTGKYIKELYDARMLDRTEAWRPVLIGKHRDVPSRIKYYTYTAVGHEFRWAPTPRKAYPKNRGSKKERAWTSAVKSVLPAPKPAAPKSAPTPSKVAQILEQVKDLSIRDVRTVLKQIEGLFA